MTGEFIMTKVYYDETVTQDALQGKKLLSLVMAHGHAHAQNLRTMVMM